MNHHERGAVKIGSSETLSKHHVSEPEVKSQKYYLLPASIAQSTEFAKES